MIIGFFDQGTEDIYNGIPSKFARKILPSTLWQVALRKFYFSRYQVQLGNACREALLRVGGIVKQSLKNTHYQVELGNEKE